MQGRLSLLGFGIATLAACAVASTDVSTNVCGDAPPASRAAAEAGPAPRHKPEAPVNVEVRADEIRPGIYDITLEATPWVDVTFLTVTWLPPAELRLEHPAPVDFGATRAGRTRSARVRAELAGSGVDILASVKVGAGDQVRAAKLVAHTLGSPPPAPARATRLVTLPSGEVIEEVVR